MASPCTQCSPSPEHSPLATSLNSLDIVLGKGSVTYRFCPRQTLYGRWGWGGEFSACDISRWKIVENSVSLMKILNILKSSIQNPAFSYMYLHMYAHYQLLALPQVYFILFYTKLNFKACTINNRKKFVTFLRGGGGLQKNAHVTFLVDKIDMCSFPN